MNSLTLSPLEVILDLRIDCVAGFGRRAGLYKARGCVIVRALFHVAGQVSLECIWFFTDVMWGFPANNTQFLVITGSTKNINKCFGFFLLVH